MDFDAFWDSVVKDIPDIRREVESALQNANSNDHEVQISTICMVYIREVLSRYHKCLATALANDSSFSSDTEKRNP